MLEPWARRHKGWKKMLAWAGYQRRDLQSAQLLHATTEAEALNLRGMRLGPVEVIPNGVDPPAWSFRRRDADDRPRTALFLGRLYPVKGLPMLIEAWSRVRPKDWRLEIAGPDEAGHRAELEALVQKTGLAEVVAFRGPLAGRDKGEALASADLFVLPSHSESFGIVVAEALAHGAPVLTTTAVPWEQLERQACGWRVAPSVSALAEGLSTATGLSRGRLREMGQRGRVLVLAEYGWERVAQAFVGAYEGLARGARQNHKTLIQAA
jgi:glycosyltransferase involved in cell wall biosynthesis